MKILLTALLAAVLLVAFAASAYATAGPAKYGVYGTARQADYLANLEIGRYNRQVDYRFKAEMSGTTTKVRVYFIQGAGYTAGNGGDINVSIQTDSGGNPSGTILGQTTILDPLLSEFRDIPITANLTNNVVYHLVFKNTDPAQATNWSSIDDLGEDARTTPVQKFIPDSDLAVQYRDGAGAWIFNPGHSPIYTLSFSGPNGTNVPTGPGAPYVNARSQSLLRQVWGSTVVGQNFTPANAFLTKSLNFRLRKVGSPGTLNLGLRNAANQSLYSFNIPAASIAAGVSWVTGTLATAQNTPAGALYHLVLSCPTCTSTNRYETWPLTEGDQGFFSPWMFREGSFEYSTNGGTNWTTSANDDAQFAIGLG